MERFFATCARGLEPVLADELRALGAADVAADRGGAYYLPRSQTPVWECTSTKLCFAVAGRGARETEFRGPAFPNRSLGTRRMQALKFAGPDRAFANALVTGPAELR